MVPDIILPVLARKHASTSETLRCQKSRMFSHSQINQYLAADQSGPFGHSGNPLFAPRSAACFAVSAGSLPSGTYGIVK